MYLKKTLFCVGILSAIDEENRIWSWIQIRTRTSVVQISGFGSKCYLSTTLIKRMSTSQLNFHLPGKNKV
jgi:hypothetical protein